MNVQMNLIHEDRVLEKCGKYKLKTNTTFTENNKYNIIDFLIGAKKRVTDVRLIRKYTIRKTKISIISFFSINRELGILLNKQYIDKMI